MRLVFTPHGWADYLYWQPTDKAMTKRINRLLEDVVRDPTGGIGKPEPLRHVLQGAWSRRIDSDHRLVYLVEGDDIVVLQAGTTTSGNEDSTATVVADRPNSWSMYFAGAVLQGTHPPQGNPTWHTGRPPGVRPTPLWDDGEVTPQPSRIRCAGLRPSLTAAQ